MPKGKIHPTRTMFLRINVGKASDSKGTYEMTVQSADMSPIVCSEKTGKYFTLSWTDIINMAVAAGIDKKEKKK